MSSAAPWRDPRYAPDAVTWRPREDGGGVLANPAPLGPVFPTACAPLDHWAARDGGRTWLAERSGAGWRTLSFAEAAEGTAALAGGLSGFGSGLGLDADRPLLILARNGIDTALATYAAMRAGIAAAPVTPQYGLAGAEPSRLRHALALLQPGAVYVDDPAAYACALADAPLAPGTPVIGPADLERLSAGASAPDIGRTAAVAKLLLTSGSTGAPKAVALSHANLAVNAAQVTACYDDPDPPVMINSAPWSHSLGAHAILHLAAHRGGTLHIDGGQPTPARFGETLRNLAEVETTYQNMVPAGWALLADALDRDPALGRTFFARLRVMQYGGAGLPADVLRRVQEAAVRACGERITFAAGYGVTETTPTVSNVRWPNDRSGLLGSPVPGTELKLAPVGGAKLEVRVRGPQVAIGYRRAGGEVAPLPLDEEGFYATGDAGRLAEPTRPGGGIVFDGRLVENFKLATGAFVATGALRLAAVSALGGLVTDAVVCGENQAGAGLLLFPNPLACAELDPCSPSASEVVRAAVRARLEAMNAEGAGAAGRVRRALVLDGGPDAASGELTDKGYLNQALARARRPAEIARLFAAEPDRDVLVL